MKIDVEFTSENTLCRGWFFQPRLHQSAACIIMAHGFAATKEARLGNYAERFCKAGFSVLVFDYRCFGDSAGRPRQMLSIPRQLQDWHSAIQFARTQSGVDPEKIVLWGTSFSGGHVLRVAAEDKRIAAVISQCPFVDGVATASLTLRHNFRSSALTMVYAISDAIGYRLGREAKTIPIVAAPGQVGAMTSPDAEPGYRAISPENFNNTVVARCILQLFSYRPRAYAKQIECPLLIQVCDQDSVTPPAPAVRTAEQAPYGECRRYALGHFDIYLGEPFELAIADQLDFLQRMLKNHQPRPLNKQ